MKNLEQRMILTVAVPNHVSCSREVCLRRSSPATSRSPQARLQTIPRYSYGFLVRHTKINMDLMGEFHLAVFGDCLFEV